MRKPVIAANWKMNHGPSDAKAFLRSFLVHYSRRADRTVIIFPSATCLTTVVDGLRERQDILVGVQNIHWEDKGAFTGETSGAIARDAGARLVLVGHSERRHLFGETDEQAGLKCAAAVRSHLTPMLCVGEKLEERERAETERVVLRQLRAGIATLEPKDVGKMCIAYEPVWAIGTGRTAKPEDATPVHRAIRNALADVVGRDRAASIPVLYGGSVNRENAASLLAAPEIDGLLVGGASLDAEAWATIART
ncbi:MAG TPA: triose-phosphate isomerase [Gemmatimonadaceae bacterium]|nr:triose-phosphate isomerase [Gemmatimonadaceae bacterium]